MRTLRMIGAAVVAIIFSSVFSACGSDDPVEDMGNNKLENGGGEENKHTDEEVSLNVSKAGTLESLLGDDVDGVVSLTVSGQLNGDDIHYLRKMFSSSSCEICVLDLLDASIVAGGDAYYTESYSDSNGYHVDEYYTAKDEIGDYMFYSCFGLREIILPSKATMIGDWAFRNCTNLMQVTIGNSVSSIGDWAFSFCAGLTAVNLPNNLVTIGDYAFYNCSGLTQVIVPNGVTTVGDDAFYKCTGLTEITIGNSVTSIGSEAFSGCTQLSQVTIPNNVKTIGSKAFQGCSGMTEVNIGEGVTEIGSYAFTSCTGLKEVTIPNSVTTIGNGAFYECFGLNEVSVGKKVTSIGYLAFGECVALGSITSLNPEPPTCDTSIGGVFYNVRTNTCVLYVPKGSKMAYSSADGWSVFTTIEEM